MNAHFRNWKPIAAFAGAVLFLAPVPLAPAQPMGHATDFTSTDYFDPPHQNQVKSILSGSEALPQPGGSLLIRKLKLRTFDINGRPEMTVTAPECLYDVSGGTASSAGPLELENGDGKFRISGEGFLWRQTNSLLTISNQVLGRIEGGAKAMMKP